MPELAAYFSPDGPLAEGIPGFRARTQQIAMAEGVEAAINHRRPYIVEAGTGTGKTFAYLVPAMLAGGKVIISTGTKTLQDQLFHRDIPTVRKALKVPITVALLKGRANYVCRYHLERALVDGRFPSRDDVRHLQQIARFANISNDGDKGSLSSVPENAAAWNYATSTRDNCLGQECPHFKSCFVMEARRQAMQADLVVVNHHLFFADLWLRDEGASELLPACNTVIFDEAHQLGETATLFFGDAVSTGQLMELVRDCRTEALTTARDFQALPPSIDALELAVRQWRMTLNETMARLSAQRLQERPDFHRALQEVHVKLDNLAELLEGQAERSEMLAQCARRAEEMSKLLDQWRSEQTADRVRWLEVFQQGMQLNATPLDIADIFRKSMADSPRAWIFTSATLAVGGNFSHYQGEMGLDDAECAAFDSPFDYINQSLLYVPTGLPNPNDPQYHEAVVNAALPIIKASQGRAFLLFTSLRAMRAAHGMLQEAFEREQLSYPLLLQGDGTRTELLDRFRSLGNAVLVASQSFWEGVDVRGEALSLVVIDRLPFAPPDDPVLAARLDQINRNGGNAFFDYQLPRTVINLKQGAGRLIRAETDRGVLMICDPRLVEKSYGRTIFEALPRMRRTRQADVVARFFALPAAE